jgi:hypothetical protein
VLKDKREGTGLEFKTLIGKDGVRYLVFRRKKGRKKGVGSRIRILQIEFDSPPLCFLWPPPPHAFPDRIGNEGLGPCQASEMTSGAG